MNLTERAKKLMELHRKWKPVATGYERYGKDSDIEHIQYLQQQEGYRFMITELGGSTPKNDRIRKLVPLFENTRFYLPRRLIFVNVEGKSVDLIHQLINEEYVNFPVASYDDMLDCMARIVDEELGARFPKLENVQKAEEDVAQANKDYHPIDKVESFSRTSTTKVNKTWKELMSQS